MARFNITVPVSRVAPWAAVKLKIACVSDLGVEKPVMANSKPDALREAMISRVTTGARRLNVKARLAGGSGVPEPPPLWPETLSSIVPDTVPV